MPLKSANRSAVSLPGFVLALARLAQQVVDQHLGVDLLLDVERRGVDDEIAPVLLILAAPDELRIEVAVAALIGHADRALLILLQHGLIFGRRDVLPLRLVVLERFDGLGGGLFFGHRYCPYAAVCTVTDSIILLNSPSTLALKSASI